MKKLLAMILCVMMFVALIPTAAFAGGLPVDDPLLTVKQYQKHIENMIKNTKTNVENSYKVLVGDQIVYTSAKAMDDSVVSLVDAIADPLIEKGKANKVWADACKDAIRFYLDETVSEKLAEKLLEGKALDKDGKFDNLKYAELVAKCMNDALTDKKFIAGYQAVATNFALRSLVSDMSDAIKDQYDEFRDTTVDGSFEKKFAEKYTNLVDDYIDTFATATAKTVSNNAAYVILQAAIADAQDEYDTAMEQPTQIYENAVEQAEQNRKDNQGVKTAKEDVKTAKEEVKDAEKALAKAEAVGTADEIKQAQKDLNEANNKLAKAEKAYDKAVDAADEKYLEDVAAAKADYDVADFDASWDYAAKVEEATDAYADIYQDINPWAIRVLPTVGSWN